MTTLSRPMMAVLAISAACLATACAGPNMGDADGEPAGSTMYQSADPNGCRTGVLEVAGAVWSGSGAIRPVDGRIACYGDVGMFPVASPL